jgi:hypothetical protein
MFYPHEITDKEKSWQMIAASHQMYSVKALVDLKNGKMCMEKTAHTLLIETLYGQGRMRSSWL